MDILLAVTENDLRVALEILFREESGVNVVGAVGDGISLLALLRVRSPDLVVLDWSMDYSAAELLAEIKTHQSPPRVIVLGKESSHETAALEAGAIAFVVKGDPPATLLAAVRRIHNRPDTSK